MSGRVPPEIIQRVVRQNFGRMRACYEDGLHRDARLRGRVAVRFVIGKDGVVTAAADGGSDLPDSRVVQCVVQAFRSLTFPAPDGVVVVTYPIAFKPTGEPDDPPEAPPPAPSQSTPPPAPVAPYTGRFKLVMDAIAQGQRGVAIQTAFDWHRESPGDVMALVALGEALEASGEAAAAARAYGSIVDLFPARADLRRFAGAHLERIRTDAALDLAIDTYTKAVEQRADHPSSHRFLAFALVKKREPAKAFDALAAAILKGFDASRFRGVERVLREDLGLVAAAWIKAEPSRATEINSRVDSMGGHREGKPSLRFVLTWETDANDVDFHIEDADGNRASYENRQLASGGELYADVTRGYGPECFTIPLAKSARAASYTLRAHYYARGPMGYGMGKVEIIDHDGSGGLTFDERPFVVMVDRAYVELGTVSGR